MNLSIFDVIGPVMIGPSSSHTAGAARLARVAAAIAGKPFTKVEFALHGSFAKTGVGHGTDAALLAGAMGLKQDDENIKQSFQIARERGISYRFTEVELFDVHENTVVITFTHADGTTDVIEGCSTGGGRILITRINGIAVEITAEHPTVLIRQLDEKGVVSQVSMVFARNDINIGIMRLTRAAKREVATAIIETDDKIPPHVIEQLEALDSVVSVRLIQV